MKLWLTFRVIRDPGLFYPSVSPSVDRRSSRRQRSCPTQYRDVVCGMVSGWHPASLNCAQALVRGRTVTRAAERGKWGARWEASRQQLRTVQEWAQRLVGRLDLLRYEDRRRALAAVDLRVEV